MFFSLILENAASEKIDMTAMAKQYMTSQIKGLPPPPETISTSCKETTTDEPYKVYDPHSCIVGAWDLC